MSDARRLVVAAAWVAMVAAVVWFVATYGSSVPYRDVVLATEPGRAGDASWDWSYWTEVEIAPEPDGRQPDDRQPDDTPHG